MQTRGGRKSKISKLGGRHISIISIISTNACRYEDIIGTASADIIAPPEEDSAAAMLLFDMRNVSSNSMIPASVAETMTDIVLQKMRESSSGGPIRVVIAPILEDDNGIVGDGVLSSNPNDHAVVVLDRDGIQCCCH